VSNIKTTDLSSEQVLQQKANTIYEQNNKMGKDQFLNLLMTQLKNQDPLKPADDTQFIAQMAQFSSLEQMQQMTGSFSQLKSMTMVGTYVEGTYTDPTTNEKSTVTGYADSSKFKDGKVYVSVDGKDILADDITNISANKDSYDLQMKLQTARKDVGTSVSLGGSKITGTVNNAYIKDKVVYVDITSGKEKITAAWDNIVSANKDAYDLQMKLQDAQKYVGTNINLTDSKGTGIISNAYIKDKVVYVDITNGKEKTTVGWDDIVSANKAADDLQVKLQAAQEYVGTSIDSTDPKVTGTISKAYVNDKVVYVDVTNGNEKTTIAWDKIVDSLPKKKTL
jgi:hypothetical protein